MIESKKGLALTFIVLVAIFLFGRVWPLRSQALGSQPPYRNPQLPVDHRVADLISRMTLEEKVAQIRCLWQVGAALRDEKGNFSPAKAQVLLKDGIGELGTIATPEAMKHPAEAARFTNDVQRFLVEKTRLGIPVIFHGEALHGAMMPDATSFPEAIGLASTWDVDLYQEVFTVAAAQARAQGTQQVFTPVLDVAREPRWGRTEETYGEDPYLAARLGVAAVEAFQGPGPGIDKQHVIATVKHFAGYGTSEGGRNTAPANSSLRIYREFILPPFQAAIAEGGAMGVMPSYNEIDGIPSHANKWLLQKVLREEWGFRGIVASDYDGVPLLANWHHVADNLADAAKRALEAGVDVDTPEGEAYVTIVQQVRDGRIAESTLDQAVGRVLRAKFMLGLFEDPYVDPDYAEKICRRPEDRALALKAAHKAIILLKNRNSLLPLNLTKLTSIAVIGPNAAKVRLGGYSSAPAYTVSILDGIKKKVGTNIKMAYAQGCAITEGNRTWFDAEIEPPDPTLDAQRIAEAVSIAKAADVAIVAVGDNDQTAREGINETHLGDRDSLDLVGRQDELIKAIVDTGKPTIVVLIAGRPVSIRYAAANVPAILGCWSLGQETGNAIADVLFGDYNPGGKLPITFPQNVGQLPAYYNHKPSATRRYLLTDNGALFPFGYGLSYTTFKYDNLRLASSQIGLQGQTMVSADITNTGKVTGDEVVQMYIRDRVSSVTRPIKELKGFRRITLAPGATKTVDFILGPDALSVYNEEMQRVVEPGLFDVMVGGNSVILTKATLEVVNR